MLCMIFIVGTFLYGCFSFSNHFTFFFFDSRSLCNLQCLLVKGWKGTSWSFPRGKKNKDEEDHTCAVREVNSLCIFIHIFILMPFS